MRIEVKAKLILTVVELEKEKSPADVVLAAEQHINENAALLTLAGSKTKVGIRLHAIGDYSVIR